MLLAKDFNPKEDHEDGDDNDEVSNVVQLLLLKNLKLFNRYIPLDEFLLIDFIPKVSLDVFQQLVFDILLRLWKVLVIMRYLRNMDVRRELHSFLLRIYYAVFSQKMTWCRFLLSIFIYFIQSLLFEYCMFITLVDVVNFILRLGCTIIGIYRVHHKAIVAVWLIIGISKIWTFETFGLANIESWFLSLVGDNRVRKLFIILVVDFRFYDTFLI